jgi:cytochrome c oxidase subunit 2
MTAFAPRLNWVLAPIIVATAAPLAQAAPTPPLNYLQAFGRKAETIASLTWALLILSIAVVVIVAALTLLGVLRRRTSLVATDARREPVVRPTGGVAWITIGVSISTLALLGGMAWNAYTMAAVNKPPRDPSLTIKIIAHQWWWAFHYESGAPSDYFETANEAHVPVGEPVRIEIESADVIHSFWAPALGDKIDAIPGQTNRTWLEAGKPGVYRGQCSEYCGRQHAHMGIVIVADAPADFRAWRDKQLRPAEHAHGALAGGEALFAIRCGACHAVRGASAWGKLGPDLTHLMSRKGLAANTLPNTPAHLSGWIADPQGIKPGAKMPVLAISGQELTVIRNYLATLK